MERDTLGTWMRLKLGRGSRSYGRVASFPVFGPFLRGLTRVFHLFFPLSTSRHLPLSFHEFNPLLSISTNLSRRFKHSCRFQREGRRRVYRQRTERIGSKASTCLPFGMLWRERSVSEVSRVWLRNYYLGLLTILKTVFRLYPQTPPCPRHRQPHQ